jgi:SAM-dependent methyltransferase
MAAPFSRFARFYDRFMEQLVDYPQWVDYVERIFNRFCRRQPRVILDLACGTGIPSILFARRGYQVIGVDRSAEMLAVLEAKKGDLPIKLIKADIRDFTLPEPVHAAFSLYDSINYLLTEEDLIRCFRCVRRALMPDGLFVFDMNTVYGLKRQWGTRTLTRENDQIISIWQCRFDRRTMISHLHLEFWEKLPDGTTGPGYQEEHRERAYTTGEVRSALHEAGFNRIRFFHHGTLLPVSPFSVRMMVVASVRPRADLQSGAQLLK